MKIFVTGCRGIPEIPGGIEKHCEELYPRIVARGHEVTVCTREWYVKEKVDQWRGVRLLHGYTPHKKSLEAIVHTFGSLLKARKLNPDIVHIHAVGPSLLTPLARLMGFRVVVTNHGPDYDRQKWGATAKAMLRLGEKLGGIFAHEVIAVSSVIAGIIRIRCRREAHVIFNGVQLPSMSPEHDFLDGIGVRPMEYVLAVARLVPEMGLHDLVKAFSALDTPLRLVIAGGADHESEYSRNLRTMAAADPRIIMTGYLSGEPLRQLYRHARLFVLPSYHEGLPIVLLEAMSYGLSVLVSDIPANREVGLEGDRYFRAGDVSNLGERMKRWLKRGIAESEQTEFRRQVAEKYNWDDIADRTIKIYQTASRTAVPSGLSTSLSAKTDISRGGPC